MEFILNLLYKLFGISKTAEDKVRDDVTLRSTGVYMDRKDSIEETEENIDKTVSSEITKEDQSISI